MNEFVVEQDGNRFLVVSYYNNRRGRLVHGKYDSAQSAEKAMLLKQEAHDNYISENLRWMKINEENRALEAQRNWEIYAKEMTKAGLAHLIKD